MSGNRLKTYRKGAERLEMMTKNAMLDLIATQTKEVLPDVELQSIQPSDCLADLGANSVDRAEILMRLQEALDLSVRRVELFGPRNLGELADLLLKKVNAA